MRQILIGLMGLTLALPAAAQTLDAVRQRDAVICTVHPNLPGFSVPLAGGGMQGMDADTCRAVAAATLGDAAKVRYALFPTLAEGLEAISTGRTDLIARNLTQTMTRGTELGLSAAGVTLYDGQGFLVPVALGAQDLKALDGRTICLSAGSTQPLNLADAATRLGASFTQLAFPRFADAIAAYAAGQCQALTADTSALVGVRAGAADPAAHDLLPDVISREPLGPFVRDADRHWENIVTWTVNALLEAESLGITSANAEAVRANGSPDARRLLGGSPGIGAPLGLADDWVFRVVTQVGNYAEIYDRNLGAGSALKFERGLNLLYNAGGLMYPIPMR